MAEHKTWRSLEERAEHIAGMSLTSHRGQMRYDDIYKAALAHLREVGSSSTPIDERPSQRGEPDYVRGRMR